MKLWGLCELWLARGGVVEVEMVSVGGESRAGGASFPSAEVRSVVEGEGTGEEDGDMAAFLVLDRRKRWKSGIVVGRKSLAGRPQRQAALDTAAERKGAVVGG